MGVKALYYSERDGLDMALKNPDKMLFSSKAEADAGTKSSNFPKRSPPSCNARSAGCQRNWPNNAHWPLRKKKNCSAGH